MHRLKNLVHRAPATFRRLTASVARLAREGPPEVRVPPMRTGSRLLRKPNATTAIDGPARSWLRVLHRSAPPRQLQEYLIGFGWLSRRPVVVPTTSSCRLDRTRDDLRASIPPVPVERIDPSPRNPRRKLHGIDDLAESLETYGLLQPSVVRPVGERYELVAGHRRLAAVCALGWTHIHVLVRTTEQDEAYLLTLVENLQRDDLTPREEARALETLLRERAWSTRQVAAAGHRSPAYVSERGHRPGRSRHFPAEHRRGGDHCARRRRDYREGVCRVKPTSVPD